MSEIPKEIQSQGGIDEKLHDRVIGILSSQSEEDLHNYWLIVDRARNGGNKEKERLKEFQNLIISMSDSGYL